jgi:hypothetical protein
MDLFGVTAENEEPEHAAYNANDQPGEQGIGERPDQDDFTIEFLLLIKDGLRIIGTSALSESRNAMFLRVRDPCFFQAAITFNHFCRPEILAAIGFPRSARDCRKSMPAIL